ncbi:MAG TPA: c-type cytochrome [Casimicrobiaceae bacterium]|jgi:mono/diheme cytochrome c family protein|nr:c-type cytochrome [Casimicrobiaceae bacterium]
MMKRILRWIGIVLASLVGLAIVAYIVIYILSERILRRTYERPAVSLSIPTDAASIAEGRRLATLRGCFGACHGKNGEGAVMFDQPIIARLVAPNLTTSVRKYSDAELAVIIRNGLRPDGRSVLIMPSEAFVELTDEDLGRIIASLKSVPEAAGPGGGISLGPIGRLGVVTGEFKTAARLIAETVPPPDATNAEAKQGRYLARTVCAGCHGTALRGDTNPDFTSPDLKIVAAYSPDAFAQLMRTGVALGGRNLPVMSETARIHLSQLSDSEIAALYSYLHSLP